MRTMVKAGDITDQLQGSEVRRVARPGSIEELSAVMAQARQNELSVLPMGGGSKLGWLDLPPVIDVLLDLSAFAECHYRPELGCMTAGAAVPVAVMQDELARHGQRLQLDPPSRGVTAGGMLVTSECGPISHQFGPPAAHLLNATVVLPGGEVGEVADQIELVGTSICDLRWAYPGWPHPSCVVVQLALRTHPIPQRQTWVTFPFEQPMHVAGLLEEVSLAQPVAVELNLPGMRTPAGRRAATGELAILVEGADPVVRERLGRLSRGRQAELAPAWWGRYPFRPGEIALRLTIPEGILNAVCYTLADAAGSLIPVRGSLGNGPCWAAIPGDLTPQRLVAVLEAVRDVLFARGGSAIVQWAPVALREVVAPYRHP
jgi:glycolate oxidase FAD binding subunit